MNATERPCGVHGAAFCDHSIPEGWGHCRCGLKPLDGAQFCKCLDHKHHNRRREQTAWTSWYGGNR